MSRLQRARSAITGRFVRLWWALCHPKITVLEAIERRKRRKPPFPG